MKNERLPNRKQGRQAGQAVESKKEKNARSSEQLILYIRSAEDIREKERKSSRS